jgi:hypothetical protein
MNPMNIVGLFIALVFAVAVLPSAIGAGLHEGALTVLVAAGIGYGLGAVIVSLFMR